MADPADPVDGRGTSGGFMARRADVRALLPRYAPILRWLPDYDPDDLRSDVLSGVWLWAVAVPVALSYGALAGVPPEYGLITAAAGLALYAVFGSSRHLKVTATSTMAVMSFAVVQPVAGDDPARFLALSAALAIIVGVLLLVTGVLRLGFISQFLAKPVVTGFLIGLAITIVVGQLPKLFGVPAVQGSVFDQLIGLVGSLDETDQWTLALGAGSLALIIGLRRVDPRIPGPLVAVVAGIALVIGLLPTLTSSDVARGTFAGDETLDGRPVKHYVIDGAAFIEAAQASSDPQVSSFARSLLSADDADLYVASYGGYPLAYRGGFSGTFEPLEFDGDLTAQIELTGVNTNSPVVLPESCDKPISL